MRILLVDDVQAVRELAGLVLETAGYEVASAATGAEAAALLEEQSFDIVALDLGLPDTDGAELAREIRNSDEGANVKLIALTGDVTMRSRDRFRALGFDDCIMKPFTRTELLEKIDGLCEA